MTDYKSVFASKTVWAGIVVVLATIAQFFGYEISAADQASIVVILTQAVTLIGGIVAIYGRITATRKID
ncbi:hypothetical protein [Limimaricola cinnabarinus]|uniref:Holin n=1 Tax=Limimaricola cinnabarinus LL-001 TaxID=1337093 RepID=U2Z2A0_9RHOB|nr:hypothetical protein [Limimaricola cinnabarinus]GAD55505.1 hypothetical protein MBELCI_1557 [Limimaricola cinnabarinus LL-001]